MEILQLSTPTPGRLPPISRQASIRLASRLPLFSTEASVRLASRLLLFSTQAFHQVAASLGDQPDPNVRYPLADVGLANSHRPTVFSALGRPALVPRRTPMACSSRRMRRLQRQRRWPRRKSAPPRSEVVPPKAKSPQQKVYDTLAGSHAGTCVALASRLRLGSSQWA